MGAVPTPANQEDAMNPNQIFELAERIAKLQADASKKPEKQMPRRRAPRNFKHLNRLSDDNVAELLQRKWNELDALARVVEDRGKATKKEEKKEEKKFPLTLPQVAALLVIQYPIIGALLLWWWR